MSFKSIFDSSNGGNSLQKSFEEENHLLVLMDVNTSIIIEHIETDSDHNIQVWRFKHQKVLVLILEHELINEWVFLSGLQCLLEVFHIEMS